MGRRKIEIQPIRDERNRTVTFIKRKAGLFKKAHELAVLCQVDVAVIILGSNNTFYEFSSVDMQDMIKHYERSDLNHDIKQPSDYGAYKKKTHIKLNENSGKRGSKRTYYSNANKETSQQRLDVNEEEEQDYESDDNNEDDKETSRHSVTSSIGSHSKRRVNNDIESSEPNNEIEMHRNKLINKGIPLLTTNANKKAKIENQAPTEPKFNPLQQHVQRQFQNFYHAASNTNVNTAAHPAQNTQLTSMPAESINPPGAYVNSLSNPRTVNSRPSSINGTPQPESDHSTPQITSTGTFQGSSTKGDIEKNTMRPVLRVQIPSSNNSYTAVAKSESSSASSMLDNNPNPQLNTSNLISKNTSSVRYDPSPDQQPSPKKETPTSGGPSLLMEKSDQRRMNGNRFSNTNSYGLPPMFSGSPVFVPYLATPLQPNNNGSQSLTNQTNPSSYMLQRPQHRGQQIQTPQQQHQINFQQQQQQHRFQQATNKLPTQGPTQNLAQIPGRVTSPPGFGDHSAGPLTGSLPSKFAQDLMVPSPSGSMSMFQDWSLGPKSAKNISSTNTHPNMHSTNPHDVPSSTFNNGGSGLTPYIMANQTPLSNKFFNFPSDVTDDKNANINQSNSNKDASTDAQIDKDSINTNQDMNKKNATVPSTGNPDVENKIDQPKGS